MAKSDLSTEEFKQFAEDASSKVSEFLQSFMRHGVKVDITHVETEDGPGKGFEHYLTDITHTDPVTGKVSNYQVVNSIPLFPKDL